MRGTSIGGARQRSCYKSTVTATHQGRQLIAKLSTATDPYPVVRAEAVAMNLAARVGLNVGRHRPHQGPRQAMCSSSSGSTGRLRGSVGWWSRR